MLFHKANLTLKQQQINKGNKQVVKLPDYTERSGWKQREQSFLCGVWVSHNTTHFLTTYQFSKEAQIVFIHSPSHLESLGKIMWERKRPDRNGLKSDWLAVNRVN